MKKGGFIFLPVSLIVAGSYTTGWSQDDSIDYELHIYDLIWARPAAVLAGIAGTSVFIISLLFTIPAGGLEESFNMFIEEPFEFAFIREFPDEDLE